MPWLFPSSSIFFAAVDHLEYSGDRAVLENRSVPRSELGFTGERGADLLDDGMICRIADNAGYITGDALEPGLNLSVWFDNEVQMLMDAIMRGGAQADHAGTIRAIYAR
jgi:hypothetical protein